MMFRIRFSSGFFIKLKGSEPYMTALILGWLNKNMPKIRKSPRALGSRLCSKDNGMWQYRIGGYRMLALISDDKRAILFVGIMKSYEDDKEACMSLYERFNETDDIG